MINFLAIFLLAAVAVAQEIPTDSVGIVIGGFGGGISTEIITAERNCAGSAATPPVADAPSGNIEGWVAEYVDGRIVLCGGGAATASAACFQQVIGSNQWQTHTPMRTGREYPISVVVNGEMYVMGGYAGGVNWLGDIQRRTQGGTWESLPLPMPKPVMKACAAAIDDTSLMLIGGNAFGNAEIPDVNRLDVTTGLWTPLEPLPFELEDMACLATEYNGQKGVLVTGGCRGFCGTHLNGVLFFSFETLSWESNLPPLVEARNGHSMTHLGGKPAVFGGYDSLIKSSVEVFDQGAWRVVPEDELSNPRWQFALPRYVPADTVTC